MSQVKQTHSPLTTRLAMQLAAPHTWPASIMPVLLAVSFACANTGNISILKSLLLLVICILMQSSVNTFNDYFDFKKGADSAEDNVESSDATLVYSNINPKSALFLAIGFLVVAFLIGIYIIVASGYIPLLIALVGALIVVLYSGGKTPISYLPIGELVSGFVMGGLIPLACYYVLADEFDLMVLIWSIPAIIGIALIMLTNNTCDIEKDISAGRRTLAVVLGRDASVRLYHILLVAWMVVVVANVALWFTAGLIVAPFMLLAMYPLYHGIFKNPLNQSSRIGAMGQICSINVALGDFYAASILASNFIIV